MKRAQAARDVASHLFASEDAIDLAIREVARLTLAIGDARAALNLSAAIGGETFERAAELQRRLAAARAEAVALHAALAELQAQVGLGAVAVGVGDKPDPPRREARLTVLTEAAPTLALRSA